MVREIQRRKFLMISLSSVFLPMSGCLLLAGLLRLGVRGALVRTGARAARVSRRGTLSSFGRTGATTMHLVHLTRLTNTMNRLQRVGEVFSFETGEDAINVDANDHLAECKVDGVPISNTRTDGRWLVHHSNLFQEAIGTSLAQSEEEIVHQDTRDRFVGADVLRNGAIRHIDQNRNLAGVTSFSIAESSDITTVHLTDSSYLESELSSISGALRVDHGDNLIDGQNMRLAQEACLQRPADESCEDLVLRVQSALERLENRFS